MLVKGTGGQGEEGEGGGRVNICQNLSQHVIAPSLTSCNERGRASARGYVHVHVCTRVCIRARVCVCVCVRARARAHARMCRAG